MNCSGNLTHLHFSLTLLLLFISAFPHFSFLKAQQQGENQELIFRVQIGSRPPQCRRRCGDCTHCKAIQVPTNPETTTVGSNIAGAGGRDDDGDSNYKPMSWKCKCGNLIFNP